MLKRQSPMYYISTRARMYVPCAVYPGTFTGRPQTVLTHRERYIAVARFRAINTGSQNTHSDVGGPDRGALSVLPPGQFWPCFLTALIGIMGNGPACSFVPIITNALAVVTSRCRRRQRWLSVPCYVTGSASC